MQRSPASATMNLLFCAAPPDLYAFLTAEAYPAASAPFLPIVPDVPNYTECTNDNKCATVKATHAIDKKTRADIVTMNTALANIFLEACHRRYAPPSYSSAFANQTLFLLICLYGLSTTTERLRWMIAKQTVRA